MNISEDILIKYLQGECCEEELQLLNQWLAESDENKSHLFAMEIVFKSKNLKRYSDPSFLKTEKERLYNRINNHSNKRIIIFRRVLQYAAAVVAIVLLSVGIYRFNAASDLKTLVADKGKTEHIILEDGTKIWLNKSSKLKYPSTFKGKTRTVYLEGEGYFEVTKNAKQPFVVETESMEITVLGTVFNVISAKDSDISAVTLIEGEVKVKGYGDEGLIVLSAGQKAELNKSTHRLQVKEPLNVSLDAVWHNGLIPFHQASVKDIGKVLEKLYGVKVHVDPNIPETTYSGALKSQDSINTVLRLLKNSIPIEYEIKGNEVFIRNN